MNGKRLYWIATGLISLVYLGSAIMYLLNLPMVQGMFESFGYPAYLVPILAVVKIAGILVILTRFSVPLSDLVYAGMFFHLPLAAGAHLGVADYAGSIPAMVTFCLMIVSFLTQNAARKKPSPYGSLAALRSVGS